MGVLICILDCGEVFLRIEKSSGGIEGIPPLPLIVTVVVLDAT